MGRCALVTTFVLASSMISIATGNEDMDFVDWVLAARTQESVVNSISQWWSIVETGAPDVSASRTRSWERGETRQDGEGFGRVYTRTRFPVLKDHRTGFKPKKSPNHCSKGKGAKGLRRPYYPNDYGFFLESLGGCRGNVGKAKKREKGKGKGSYTPLQPYTEYGKGKGYVYRYPGIDSSKSSTSGKSKRISYDSLTSYPTSLILAATGIPSHRPSSAPSTASSYEPSLLPSFSSVPTKNPSSIPSSAPSRQASEFPSLFPSPLPSNTPSSEPTQTGSLMPSTVPTITPTAQPSVSPTFGPTATASDPPTMLPSVPPTQSQEPTVAPYALPSAFPTMTPSAQASASPTSTPPPSTSFEPSLAPSFAGDVVRVPATPFNLEYLTGANLAPNVDPRTALRVTVQFLQSFLNFQLSFNQDANLVDTVISIPNEGELADDTTYIAQLDAVLQFERDGILPSTADVDILIFTAFSPPFVDQLLASLRAIGDGAFSTTQEVIYTPIS